LGATIAGGGASGQLNSVSGNHATIGGGHSNTVSMGASYSTIGGGSGNTISGIAFSATIGGGSGNTANSQATVAGGVNNTASGSYSTVGGGAGNTASFILATVGGGQFNTASGVAATVAGGTNNSASGGTSTVAGGLNNSAAGVVSFAAGYRAKANHQGAFVWGDSTEADVASTGVNQFIIRASGGVGINTTSPGSFLLAVNGDAAKPGGGSWSVFSDARLKRSITPMAAEGGTLDRLLTLRGYTFEYGDEAIERRLGLPGRQTGLLAQEVAEVFPDWVGTDDDGYLFVTERGVTAILVESLRELRAEKDAEIASMRSEKDAEVASLRSEVSEMRTRLELLERSMRQGRARD